MIKKFLAGIFALILFLGQATYAQETPKQLRTQSDNDGMWLPLKAADLNYEDMKQTGFSLPAGMIYDENKASLEDGIVKLNGGSCTAEMISSQGLMLTNHHCAYDAIAALSSEDADYLTDGFWAYKMEEELPVEGGTASFLIHSQEVTAQLLDEEGEPLENMDAKMEEIVTEAMDGKDPDFYEASIEEMFHGSEYYLFVYKTYKDIRMVGAPPSSIGKFGGDTDNWMWPRQTGDFSLLRVYASPDGENNPAEYSRDNVPYKPDHFFPISLKGVEEFDYSMIMGYPGSTSRYLTSSAVQMALDQSNKDMSNLLGIRARAMKAEMDKSDAVRIAMASDYASIMNYYKYLLGQTTMMNRYDVVGEKKVEEAEFQKWVDADPDRKNAYGGVLKEIDDLHNGYRSAERFMNYLNFGPFQSPVTIYAYQFNPVMGAITQGDDAAKAQAIQGVREGMDAHFASVNNTLEKRAMKETLISFYNDMPKELQPGILAEMASPPVVVEPEPVVVPEPVEAPKKKKKKKKKKKNKKGKTAMASAEEVAAKIEDTMKAPMAAKSAPMSPEENIAAWVDNAFETSIFADKDRFAAFLDNPDASKVQNDPFNALIGDMIGTFRNKFALPYQSFEFKISDLRKSYLQALREKDAEQAFYPDANSTMRLTYGRVLAYEPRDGVFYNYYTTLDGVMEKEDPSSEEFVVPAKLKELWENKDYGQYANDKGELVTCILSNNDITGGNSGSPLLNANGEMIGVAFDGNWESMASDIHIFPQFNRTISVDIRYVLFIVDKFAGASRLIEEMDIRK
ncbi:MAG: S46 family peptidase [Bacteroidota bacterium]